MLFTYNDTVSLKQEHQFAQNIDRVGPHKYFYDVLSNYWLIRFLASRLGSSFHTQLRQSLSSQHLRFFKSVSSFLFREHPWCPPVRTCKMLISLYKTMITRQIRPLHYTRGSPVPCIGSSLVWDWDSQAQVQVHVSPDLLEFVDAGAATLVAAGAGDGAIEERHQRHHQGQQGGGHLLRQGHRHQRSLNLVTEVYVILALQQLSLPEIQRFLKKDH